MAKATNLKTIFGVDITSTSVPTVGLINTTRGRLTGNKEILGPRFLINALYWYTMLFMVYLCTSIAISWDNNKMNFNLNGSHIILS